MRLIPGRVLPIVSLFSTLGRLCRRKSWRNVSAVPYNAGSGVSLQLSHFREIPPKYFWPSLSTEYVTEFWGQTDTSEVRFDITDTQTHRPNYSNPRCGYAPWVNNFNSAGCNEGYFREQWGVLHARSCDSDSDGTVMVACCRCNRDGICKNCAYVKENRTCTNCLPSRRGKCSNTKQLVASTSAPVQTPTSDRNLPFHVAVADATSNAPTPSNIDIHTLSHTLSATGRVETLMYKSQGRLQRSLHSPRVSYMQAMLFVRPPITRRPASRVPSHCSQ